MLIYDQMFKGYNINIVNETNLDSVKNLCNQLELEERAFMRFRLKYVAYQYSLKQLTSSFLY